MSAADSLGIFETFISGYAMPKDRPFWLSTDQLTWLPVATSAPLIGSISVTIVAYE